MFVGGIEGSREGSGGWSMNSEIKMSVSSMTRSENKKAVYVFFQDGDKTAEFTLPGCELVKNRGFLEDDIRQLKAYIDNEQDNIFAMAKQINPIKAMMGTESKGESSAINRMCGRSGD